MSPEEFDKILSRRIKLMSEVLASKGDEYSTADDRLHNFKVAAAMSEGSQKKALWGFLLKHLVSLYDLVNEEESRPMEVWEEKIGDAINYLVLLEAVVAEEKPETISFAEIDLEPTNRKSEQKHSKTSLVLEHQGEEVYGSARVYARDGFDVVVSIGGDYWADFGSPSHITVVIEPGDQLNNRKVS